MTGPAIHSGRLRRLRSSPRKRDKLRSTVSLRQARRPSEGSAVVHSRLATGCYGRSVRRRPIPDDRLEIVRAELWERDAAHADFGYVTVTVLSGTRAAYFPGTQRLTVKMTAERPHRAAAGRPDRRQRGLGQADRHRRDRALEPHDRRGDDRPGPGVCPTVLAGLGPHPGRRPPGLGRRPRRPLSPV